MRVIQQMILNANSSAGAWYQLRLLEIAEGYVIEKRSGRRGAEGQMECWFRWTQLDAEKVFSKIYQAKTRPGRKRVYVENKDPSKNLQLSLF
jgi:hypothetical protein